MRSAPSRRPASKLKERGSAAYIHMLRPLCCSGSARYGRSFSHAPSPSCHGLRVALSAGRGAADAVGAQGTVLRVEGGRDRRRVCQGSLSRASGAPGPSVPDPLPALFARPPIAGGYAPPAATSSARSSSMRTSPFGKALCSATSSARAQPRCRLGHQASATTSASASRAAGETWHAPKRRPVLLLPCIGGHCCHPSLPGSLPP